MKTYIIVMRDDHYFLVGPFADNATAGEWGTAHNAEDDPRWQTISLDLPRAAPNVMGPQNFDMADLATLDRSLREHGLS